MEENMKLMGKIRLIFEKILLINPNKSCLWLAYISTEIENHYFKHAQIILDRALVCLGSKSRLIERLFYFKKFSFLIFLSNVDSNIGRKSNEKYIFWPENSELFKYMEIKLFNLKYKTKKILQITQMFIYFQLEIKTGNIQNSISVLENLLMDKRFNFHIYTVYMIFTFIIYLEDNSRKKIFLKFCIYISNKLKIKTDKILFIDNILRKLHKFFKLKDFESIKNRIFCMQKINDQFVSEFCEKLTWKKKKKQVCINFDILKNPSLTEKKRLIKLKNSLTYVFYDLKFSKNSIYISKNFIYLTKIFIMDKTYRIVNNSYYGDFFRHVQKHFGMESFLLNFMFFPNGKKILTHSYINQNIQLNKLFFYFILIISKDFFYNARFFFRKKIDVSFAENIILDKIKISSTLTSVKNHLNLDKSIFYIFCFDKTKFCCKLKLCSEFYICN
nr:hypothetical protein 1634Bnrm2_p108 [Cryptomonas sp.]